MNEVNAVITGAAGFIGYNLFKTFKRKGYTTIGFDNFYSVYRDNINHADFRDSAYEDSFKKYIEKAISKTCKTPYIIHCAAISRVICTTKDYADNLNMLANVIEWSREFNPVIIFCSSSAIYGDPPMQCHNPKPRGWYGLSKLQGERMLYWAKEKYGLKSFSLRLPNVYGPGQWSGESGAVRIFLRSIMNQHVITIRNPKHVREYIYIDDIVNLVDMLVHRKPSASEIFSVSAGMNNPLGGQIMTSELLDMCFQVTGDTTEFIIDKPNPDKDQEMDCTLQVPETIYDWEPKISLREGVEQTWKALLKEKQY